METRLIEVNQLANLSQVKLEDTTEVLQSLEERLKMTEVCILRTYAKSFCGFIARRKSYVGNCLRSSNCEFVD